MNDHKVRIIGIDISRALAIFGMIIVNYRYSLGAFAGNNVLNGISDFLLGKAAATFVVLSGIGIILLTNKSRSFNSKKKNKLLLLKRALFFFIIGSVNLFFWPGDILRNYGVFFAIALFFIYVKKEKLIYAFFVTIIIFLISLVWFDYSKDWDSNYVSYLGLYELKGFFKSLLINGRYPVIPWIAFVFWGMFLGLSDLQNKSNLRKILIYSSVIFVVTQILSFLLKNHYTLFGANITQEKATMLFGTQSVPPNLFYLFTGASFASIVIVLCIILGEYFHNNFIINFMAKTGQCSLTLYIAHIYIGLPIYFGYAKLLNISKPWSLIDIKMVYYYTLFLFLLLGFSSNVWLKYFRRGPIEALMRSITR